MINCESCRELLPEFSLGDLEPQDLKKVKFHLKSCRACAIELSQYRKIWATLPLALDPVEPPAEMKVQLMNRVEKSAKVNRSSKKYSRRRNGTPTWASIDQRTRRLLMVTAALLALFVYNQFGSVSDSRTEQIAAAKVARQRIANLANSSNLPAQYDRDFVHIEFKEGAAYGSLASKPDGYLIWHRQFENWHVSTSSVEKDPREHLKIWFQDKDGKIVDSMNLNTDAFGNSEVAVAANGRAFAKTMVTLETDASSKLPSQRVVFESNLFVPIGEPVKLSEDGIL